MTFGTNLGLLSTEWRFDNYLDGWNALRYPFDLYLVNSLIIAALTIVGNLLSCAMAAYSRPDFPGRKVFFAPMLGTLMLPGHVLLIPQYILFSQLGWLNTYLPLVVPNFLASNAFFSSSWNEFSLLLYLTDAGLYTVPLAPRQFIDSEGQSSWGQMFAMSVVSLAPIIGFFIAGQKYLVKGIATTGLK